MMSSQAPETGSWAEKVMQAAGSDLRKQPWREQLEKMHQEQTEEEDMLDLQLPNHVQSSGSGSSNDIQKTKNISTLR